MLAVVTSLSIGPIDFWPVIIYCFLFVALMIMALAFGKAMALIVALAFSAQAFIVEDTATTVLLLIVMLMLVFKLSASVMHSKRRTMVHSVEGGGVATAPFASLSATIETREAWLYCTVLDIVNIIISYS